MSATLAQLAYAHLGIGIDAAGCTDGRDATRQVQLGGTERERHAAHRRVV